VHDHQLAQHRVVGDDRLRRDVQRAVGQLEHRIARLATLAGRAAHRVRERGRGERQLAGAVAEAERENALALHDALEVALHALARAGTAAHQLDQRVLRRLHYQRAAHVEVAHEPLEGEAIDQRHHRVGDGGER
jgi:hypothetical protein